MNLYGSLAEWQAQQGNPAFRRKDRITMRDIRWFVDNYPFHAIGIAWADMLIDVDFADDEDYYPLSAYQQEAEEGQAMNCQDVEWDIYLEFVGEHGGWPDA